ncbi:amidase [Paenibacillus sp. NPDC058071]|uniref:amidase n=1 Tax=Paenibacillus sp. NPDC058071 TaxID=3346326 RepID=UPI0036DE0741
MKDAWNAFVDLDNPFVSRLPRKAGGSLEMLKYAVKDVYDIQGYVPSAGNPDWKRTHKAAQASAESIRLLSGQGARLLGMTHTDELMFGLNGENEHYGTPVNPRASQRIPGGSSSGSAAAVASGLVDFAMGTDTAGSVRVPASYCGVYGIRPTYGQVSMQGIVPLASTFDTAGWMANSLSSLLKVGEVLLPEKGQSTGSLNRFIWATEMWELLDEEVRSSIQPLLHRVRSFPVVHCEQSISPNGLQGWLDAFRLIQGFEIWSAHKEWIEQTKPSFAADVAARFLWASTIREEDARNALAIKWAVSHRLAELLGRDTVLIVPTAPGIAPLRQLRGEAAEHRRNKTLQLCCVSGLAGLPQVTVPWIEHEGAPLGLSFIAGPGQDLNLIRLVQNVADIIGCSREKEEHK